MKTVDERDQAIVLANRLLDEVCCDPDDDLRVLSRQLLRRIEEVEHLTKERDDFAERLHNEFAVSIARGQEIGRLNALINTPHTHDFIEAVRLEMPHQRERWGSSHDAGKTNADWIALAVYLLGKATRAHYDGDNEKLKHHVVTSAAALGNWFLALTGEDTRMRPGVGTTTEGQNT
jgi:hypothetical protein